MRQRGILQIQSLWRFRLQSHAIARQVQQLSDACADRGSMGADFRRGQNQAGVHICDRIAGVVYSFQRFAQKYDRIRALPLRIGGRKQRADIGRRD